MEQIAVSTVAQLAVPHVPAGMVLRPLTEATAQAIEPVLCAAYEYLVLSMDAEGVNFEARVVCASMQDGKLVQLERPISEASLQFLTHGIPGSKDLSEDKRRKTQPHLRYTVQREWRLPPTDYTALLIHSRWPQNRILCRGEHAKVQYEFLIKRFVWQSRRAEMAAAFKIAGTMPMMPVDWVEHPDPRLRLSPYQKVAVLYCLGHSETALLMDRGTGKTPTATQVLCMEAKRFQKDLVAKGATPTLYKALIVCPPQVCTNWRHEMGRFAVVPGKVVVARGSIMDRIRMMTQCIVYEPGYLFAAVIINYESLANTIDHFALVPWNKVITDESHEYKAGNTKRYRAMQMVRECSKARIGMTGTPIGNSIMDLWAQLEYLGIGLSGFNSFKAFRDFHGKYMSADNGQSAVQRLVGLKNIPLLQERLTRIAFMITKEEAGLNLPPKSPETVDVEMTELQAKYYSRVADELALEIKDKLSGKVTSSLLIENILTSLLRLAQITSGYITWDARIDPDDGRVVEPKRIEQIGAVNPKVEELIRIIKDPERDPKGKMVVWVCFTEDVRIISARLEKEGIVYGTYYGGTSHADRETNVWRFNNDPEFRVLIANPAAAAEGLNLIGYNPDDDRHGTYCDTLVYFSRNWSMIKRAQSEDRAHRRGTKVELRIIDLIVPDTIDEDILARLESKQQMALAITDLKGILKSVLGIEV